MYYIEPYEKSLAKKLHADAIDFETEDDEADRDQDARNANSTVKFIHFEGVTPRQYLNFFQMTKRKDSAKGTVIKIMPKDAPKAVTEYLDDYRSFEAKVVQKLKGVAPVAPFPSVAPVVQIEVVKQPDE